MYTPDNIHRLPTQTVCHGVTAIDKASSLATVHVLRFRLISPRNSRAHSCEGHLYQELQSESLKLRLEFYAVSDGL